MSNVYSLADTKVVLSHPKVGTANLHLCGTGKVVITASGDLSSHSTTADGYVVVNKLKSVNGMVTVEVPQNSIGDTFLRKWIRYLRNCAASQYLNTTLTITDAAGGFTILCTQVTPQKVPDRSYDRSSTNVTYTFLAAEITEK